MQLLYMGDLSDILTRKIVISIAKPSATNSQTIPTLNHIYEHRRLVATSATPEAAKEANKKNNNIK